MMLYFTWVGREVSLLPTILVGWDKDDDFYIEVGWMNVFLGVSFG